eukprot:GHVT01101573.1.p1 GENE.GHVT01101573.1~~GHVT01101573.1.p1  ORF type:complete len:1026 (+),score=238.67 GHVT01101573.1:337-3414(+)
MALASVGRRLLFPLVCVVRVLSMTSWEGFGNAAWIGFTLLGWYGSSLSLTAANKVILDTLGLPYPLLLTFTHFTLMSLTLFAASTTFSMLIPARQRYQYLQPPGHASPIGSPCRLPSQPPATRLGNPAPTLEAPSFPSLPDPRRGPAPLSPTTGSPTHAELDLREIGERASRAQQRKGEAASQQRGLSEVYVDIVGGAQHPSDTTIHNRKKRQFASSAALGTPPASEPGGSASPVASQPPLEPGEDAVCIMERPFDSSLGVYGAVACPASGGASQRGGPPSNAAGSSASARPEVDGTFGAEPARLPLRDRATTTPRTAGNFSPCGDGSGAISSCSPPSGIYSFSGTSSSASASWAASRPSVESLGLDQIACSASALGARQLTAASGSRLVASPSAQRTSLRYDGSSDSSPASKERKGSDAADGPSASRASTAAAASRVIDVKGSSPRPTRMCSCLDPRHPLSAGASAPNCGSCAGVCKALPCACCCPFSRCYRLHVSRLFGRFAAALEYPSVSKSYYFRRILPIAVMTALEISLSNAAYPLVSISVITVVKSTLVVFTYLLSVMWGIESFSFSLLFLLGLIVVSVVAGLPGMAIRSSFGIVLLLIAVVASACRWIFVHQHLHEEHGHGCQRQSQGGKEEARPAPLGSGHHARSGGPPMPKPHAWKAGGGLKKQQRDEEQIEEEEIEEVLELYAHSCEGESNASSAPPMCDGPRVAPGPGASCGSKPVVAEASPSASGGVPRASRLPSSPLKLLFLVQPLAALCLAGPALLIELPKLIAQSSAGAARPDPLYAASVHPSSNGSAPTAAALQAAPAPQLGANRKLSPLPPPAPPTSSSNCSDGLFSLSWAFSPSWQSLPPLRRPGGGALRGLYEAPPHPRESAQGGKAPLEAALALNPSPLLRAAPYFPSPSSSAAWLCTAFNMCAGDARAHGQEPLDVARIVGACAIVYLSCILSFLLIVCELEMVRRTSALSLTIGGVGKEIAAVAMSVSVFGERMPASTLAWIAMSLVCIVVYTVVRAKRQRKL